MAQSVASTMTSIIEATAPTQQNLARVREAFESLPDAELAGVVSAQPDTAKGVMAPILLAERRAAKAEQSASLALDRHDALLRAITTPHWSQTQNFWVSVIAALSGVAAVWYSFLTYQQGLQSSAQAQQASSIPPSVVQKSASFPVPSASSPTSSSSGSQK